MFTLLETFSEPLLIEISTDLIMLTIRVDDSAFRFGRISCDNSGKPSPIIKSFSDASRETTQYRDFHKKGGVLGGHASHCRAIFRPAKASPSQQTVFPSRSSAQCGEVSFT